MFSLFPGQPTLPNVSDFHGNTNRRAAITRTPQRACCRLHDYKQQTIKAERCNCSRRNDITPFPTRDLKTTHLFLLTKTTDEVSRLRVILFTSVKVQRCGDIEWLE
jgi:hypothetical protein